MLKAIFTIDCDFCREPLATAAVCCDFETLVWESFAWDLKTYAQTQGWDYDEKRNRFLCVDCSQQIEEVRNSQLATSPANSITLNTSEAGWAHHAIDEYVSRKQFAGQEIVPALEELEEKLNRFIDF